MNARDELAAVINEVDRVASTSQETRQYALRIADAILDAGYRKPSRVTTVDEIDGLPDMTVILNDGVAWQREGLSWHEASSFSARVSSVDLVNNHLSDSTSLILYAPEEAR